MNHETYPNVPYLIFFSFSYERETKKKEKDDALE